MPLHFNHQTNTITPGDNAESAGIKFSVSGFDSRITAAIPGITGNQNVTLTLGMSSIRQVKIEPVMNISQLTSAPAYLEDGMIAFADGSPTSAGWNPGWNQGIYQRMNSSWHRLIDTRMKSWVSVNYQTGTTYTISENDLGEEIEMAGANDKTVIVPFVSAVPGAAGNKSPGSNGVVSPENSNRIVYLECMVTQTGSGQVYLSAGPNLAIIGPTQTSADGYSLLLRWVNSSTVRTKVLI